MGREWMIPDAERRYFYSVRVWPRDGYGDFFSDEHEIVCYPSDLEEEVEEVIDREYGSSRLETMDWEISYFTGLGH